MKTAKECRKCGEWFKDWRGNMYCFPESHDHSLCEKCNEEIDNKENKKHA